MAGIIAILGLVLGLSLGNPLITQLNYLTFGINLLSHPPVTQPTGGLGIKARFWIQPNPLLK